MPTPAKRPLLAAATLSLLAGCLATPLGTSTGTGGALEPPETSPYVAPSFDGLPTGDTMGQWKTFSYASQNPAGVGTSAAPTSSPSPTALPDAGYAGVELKPVSRTILTVGDNSRLETITPLPADAAWGVLENERARISATGELTAIAPGPVHVYLAARGKRAYVLLAVVPAERPWRDVPGGTLHTPSTTPRWSSLLRSPADWRQYWSHLQDPRGGIQELPEGVDFTTHDVLAVYTPAGIGYGGIALTALGDDDHPIEATVTANGQMIGPAVVMHAVGCFAIPKRAVPPRLFVTHLGTAAEVPLAEPDGPPAATPTPVPSPSATTSPGLLSPPFPPPGPKPASADDCQPYLNGSSRPFSLQWADRAPENLGATPAVTPDWEPVVPVGQPLRLRGRFNGPPAPVTWRVANPATSSVDADGRVSALRPGAIAVEATAGSNKARAIVAAVAVPAPAVRFRFADPSSGTDVPADATPRGARILTSAAAWAEFWRTSFKFPVQALPAAPDFTRYDVVALVHDRSTWNEAEPVLTHVSHDGKLVHLVYSGTEDTMGQGYYRRVFLYAVGKLPPDASVQVHSLCTP